VTKKRETLEVERGKPHKRETQILVGELLIGTKQFSRPVMVDKYLSRKIYVQNKAYKLLFFLSKKGVSILFEIGNSLKEARISSGVTLKEIYL